ncbi:hypothetical protein GCM10009780_09650 [Actinomadura alba]
MGLGRGGAALAGLKGLSRKSMAIVKRRTTDLRALRGLGRTARPMALPRDRSAVKPFRGRVERPRPDRSGRARWGCLIE